MHDETRFTPEMIEQGRLLFAGETRFEKGVVHIDAFPEDNLVEIAIAGRSNVGKSSLINAITGRVNIARISNTPGRTQELNLFIIGEERPHSPLRMVDMPGYGYAKAPKDKVKIWTELIFTYLRGRVPLRRVLLLIDARHGLKKSDMPVLDLLDESAVSYQIILTKADKLHAKEQAKIHAATYEALRKRPAAHPYVHLTSSAKKEGIDLLRAEIASLLV